MQDPLLKKIKDKGKAKVMNDDALGVESILNCLSQWAKEREGEEALNVAVVGVSNVRFSHRLYHPITHAILGGQEFLDQLSTQTSGLTYLQPCLFIKRTIYNRGSSRSHSRSRLTKNCAY